MRWYGVSSPWYAGWDDPGKLLDVLSNPFKYAVDWLAAWGGVQLLPSLLALSTVLYVWWHAKDALPAGLVGVALGFVLLLFPEIRLAAYVLLGFGAGALIWKIAREVA